jgi:PTS system nitrogen regulatory IIA component
LQLSIRDLTRLLNVGEGIVARWIRQRGLPARQVGGQYWVNRAELLEWATTNNVQVSVELFDQLEAAAADLPSLADALAAGGIHYDVPGDTKEQVLGEVVRRLPVPDDVDRQFLLRLFLAREATASTGVGDGIAIPHVRAPIVLHVEQPAVTLSFLANAVEFGAADGKPVHVLVSIVSPTARGHLQLLSRLAAAFHDKSFRDAVVRHARAEDILREVRRVESAATANGATSKQSESAPR